MGPEVPHFPKVLRQYPCWWELRRMRARSVCGRCLPLHICLPRPLEQWVKLRTREIGSEATTPQWTGYLCLGRTWTLQPDH